MLTHSAVSCLNSGVVKKQILTVIYATVITDTANRKGNLITL